MPHGISKNVPLAPRTTLGVGGNAEYFAEVKTITELNAVLEWAKNEHITSTILGGGSNVLIDDAGVPGLTIGMKIQGITYVPGEDGFVYVTAAAGESWDAFVSDTTKKGLWGLENLSGIPGQVGAAPIQNINAYGASVADLIVSVDVLHCVTTERSTFHQVDCRFGYRDSFFKTEKGKEYIVTGVTFRLSKTKKMQTSYRSSLQSVQRYLEEHAFTEPTPEHIREAIIAIRKNIGMLEGMYRSAGSFFKNPILNSDTFKRVQQIVTERHTEKEKKFTPWYWELPHDVVKVSTAFLMECTPYNKNDFREKTFRGRVGISPVHTLSVVNVHDAQAEDIKAFVEEITNAVEKEFGIRIETEVCFIS
jgi:UDP-N-acetylmuramate dehydrogenase